MCVAVVAFFSCLFVVLARALLLSLVPPTLLDFSFSSQFVSNLFNHRSCAIHFYVLAGADYDFEKQIIFHISLFTQKHISFRILSVCPLSLLLLDGARPFLISSLNQSEWKQEQHRESPFTYSHIIHRL